MSDRSWRHVYVIYRLDLEAMRAEDPLRLQEPSPGGGSACVGGLVLNVKEVLPTEAAAEAEVTRLNELNGPRGCVYSWQSAKWYGAEDEEPETRAVDS